MSTTKQKFLLVGGLGHTDLSGKVPRVGLLMLRTVLQEAGHEAVVENYAMSLNEQLFPPALSGELVRMYGRSIKPFVADGRNPWMNPVKSVRFALDMKRLHSIGSELMTQETSVFRHLAKSLATKIRREGFDAVGFSLYLGSSTTGAIIIADILRQRFPDLPIFFGGPQTTHFHHTILGETHSPTALVLGEGELSIVALAERLADIKAGNRECMREVPNLCFRDASGEIVLTPRRRLSVTEWVEQSRAGYCERDFDGLLRHAFIETSRGCSNMCRFCAQPLISGTDRYLKPAKNIVDEMVRLHQDLGINKFEFVGSSTPPSQAESVAEELGRRNLHDAFEWTLFMRARDDSVQAPSQSAFMEKIRKAGCAAIFFGVEAADDQTLQKMGKNEKVEETKAAMVASRNAGIGTIGSFIYPYPGMPDNEDDLILSFLDEVRPLSAPVQPLGLYPGTWCACHADEAGCEVVYPVREDQDAYEAGGREPPTMDSPEVLSYLLRYPLILSLPMRFWPAFPYKIDGMSYKQYQKKVSKLAKQIAGRGILLGFSHSHYLLAGAVNMTPQKFSECMLYCTITGDPEFFRELVQRCNTSR